MIRKWHFRKWIVWGLEHGSIVGLFQLVEKCDIILLVVFLTSLVVDIVFLLMFGIFKVVLRKLSEDEDFLEILWAGVVLVDLCNSDVETFNFFVEVLNTNDEEEISGRVFFNVECIVEDENETVVMLSGVTEIVLLPSISDTVVFSVDVVIKSMFVI